MGIVSGMLLIQRGPLSRNQIPNARLHILLDRRFDAQKLPKRPFCQRGTATELHEHQMFLAYDRSLTLAFWNRFQHSQYGG